MRDLNQMTITDAVKASFKSRKNERLAFLIDKLIEHLHDYTREVSLTHAEWMTALNFLYDCGQDLLARAPRVHSALRCARAFPPSST